MVSPNYRREAELIVQEENEAKSKMPTYKGLEKFKLLEKMGEYVSSRHVTLVAFTKYRQSGAFSNVYKAFDLSTGKKVAGMESPYMLFLYRVESCSPRAQSRLFVNSSSMHLRLGGSLTRITLRSTFADSTPL